MRDKKYICSTCKSDEVVDIVYGYPTDETLQSWFKKDVELGGCIVGEENRHINALSVAINGKKESQKKQSHKQTSGKIQSYMRNY